MAWSIISKKKNKGEKEKRKEKEQSHFPYLFLDIFYGQIYLHIYIF